MPDLAEPFKPALLIVDFQNDFCPPNGSLAVKGGRDIASTVNFLLSLPFAMRIATKDFHPRDHISFASNHQPPENKPFETMISIRNPLNHSETEPSRLWPDHCIQGTPGCELVSELDQSKLDLILEKGQDARVEMYSAFAAPFVNPVVADSGLAARLTKAGITHVYVVGLAYDYCVKATAVDAAKRGFTTYVVVEGTRPVDSLKSADDETRKAFSANHVSIVSMEGSEVELVKRITS